MKGLLSIVKLNVPRRIWRDVYHDLLVLRWSYTILLYLLMFFLTNSVFATLYWFDPLGVQHTNGEWLKCFFFSIQTFGTIGYGELAPLSTYANVIVTIESAVCTFMVAIMTGFIFAKFSRARSKIQFTTNMVVANVNGKKTLMFRIVNARKNQIIDTKIHLTALKNEPTIEGEPFRRYIDLKLVRSHAPIMTISMTFMHVIDESSPLYGMDEHSLKEGQIEFLITAIGTDSSFGQPIHAIHTYRPVHIAWNRKFQDMLEFKPDGSTVVDYGKFDLLL